MLRRIYLEIKYLLTNATGTKLRLSEDGRFLVGPDGQIIRPLLDSEIAGIILWETFHPGFSKDHLEELLYDEREVERQLAWMRDHKTKSYTKTLAISQEVYMFCGSEFYGFAKGKVVKITPAGIEVLVTGEPVIRLDSNGVELEAERRKRHSFEPGVERGDYSDRFMQSVWYNAPECGPWQLDNMPFEERTAKIEHHQRLLKIIKTLVVGQEVWMVSGPYIKGECFIKGKVVKLSPVVEVLELPGGDRKGGELRRFCFDGTQYDGNHHPEFGPWRLDDMSFAKRTALLEPAAREGAGRTK